VVRSKLSVLCDVLSCAGEEITVTVPYLAGSTVWVEAVATSDLDAVSTPCHAVAVAVAVVAVADKQRDRSSACRQHSPSAGDSHRRPAPCRGNRSLPQLSTRAQQ
jgi:hypothetical protein